MRLLLFIRRAYVDADITDDIEDLFTTPTSKKLFAFLTRLIKQQPSSSRDKETYLTRYFHAYCFSPTEQQTKSPNLATPEQITHLCSQLKYMVKLTVFMNLR